MTDHKLDAERLAALLDGRLDDHARADALRDLDADDDLRAAYADAVAVERELAESAVAAPPFRGAAPTRTRWRTGRTMLIAASLVGVTFLGWRVASSRGDLVEPGRLVRQMGIEAPLPLPEAPWAVTRGAAEGAPMSERGRAVRLGARSVDLEVAIAANDSGPRAAAASAVATLASNPPMPGVDLEQFRAIANGDARAAQDRGARR